MIRRTFAVIVTALALTLAMSSVSGADQRASGKCATVNPLALHGVGVTGMKWQYIQPDEAAYFHISPCSIVLAGVLVGGQRESMILTPSLRIVASS